MDSGYSNYDFDMYSWLEWLHYLLTAILNKCLGKGPEVFGLLSATYACGHTQTLDTFTNITVNIQLYTSDVKFILKYRRANADPDGA